MHAREGNAFWTEWKAWSGYPTMWWCSKKYSQMHFGFGLNCIWCNEEQMESRSHHTIHRRTRLKHNHLYMFIFHVLLYLTALESPENVLSIKPRFRKLPGLRRKSIAYGQCTVFRNTIIFKEMQSWLIVLTCCKTLEWIRPSILSVALHISIYIYSTLILLSIEVLNWPWEEWECWIVDFIF